MDLQHFVVKFPIEGDLKIDPEQVVDVFHRWVAGQSMPGMLVDVAELLHVPNGPGVIAVGHESDYAFDHTGGVWGLLYRQKSTLSGDAASRLAIAISAALHACAQLEEAFDGAVTFGRTTFEVIVNDRLLVPNTPGSVAEANAIVEAALGSILGQAELALSNPDTDPRWRYRAVVKTSTPIELTAPVAP